MGINRCFFLEGISSLYYHSFTKAYFRSLFGSSYVIYLREFYLINKFHITYPPMEECTKFLKWRLTTLSLRQLNASSSNGGMTIISENKSKFGYILQKKIRILGLIHTTIGNLQHFWNLEKNTKAIQIFIILFYFWHSSAPLAPSSPVFITYYIYQAICFNIIHLY